MLADSTSLHVRQQTSRSQSDPACSTRETLQANVPLKVLCSRQSHPTLYSSWHRMHWYLCELFRFLKPPHPPHLILIHGQKKNQIAHVNVNTGRSIRTYKLELASWWWCNERTYAQRRARPTERLVQMLGTFANQIFRSAGSEAGSEAGKDAEPSPPFAVTSSHHEQQQQLLLRCCCC